MIQLHRHNAAATRVHAVLSHGVVMALLHLKRISQLGHAVDLPAIC